VSDLPKAVCVVVIDKLFRVFAVARKDDPNAWGLPGGKVDPGETLEEAAKREFLEETGFSIKDLRPILTAVCKGGDQNYKTTTFLARFDTSVGEKPRKSGEAAVAYWYWDKLHAGPFGSYNAAVTSALREIVLAYLS
jgi:8-oxo-dGTP pyrophosphatase MutT (NUDIX family)